MIAIRRRDNNMWAIPGGMVEEGEAPFNTAKREFCEEAMHNAPGWFFTCNRHKLSL